MRVLVFGNGNAGYNVALHISKSTDHEVKYVFQFGATPPSDKIASLDFNEEKDCEFEIASEYNCDVAFSSGWHRKFEGTMLQRQPCFNIHPSLLPKYRGVFPLEFQLKNKEKIGGVTIHLMDRGFDTGPIYKQKEYLITENDNLTTLMIKACRAARELLSDFFDEYPNLTLIKQNENSATYFSLKDKAQLGKG